MGEPQTLGYGQVAVAACLVLINAAISLWLGLRIERSLLWASVRTVVQLLLVGLILEWVFRLDRWEGVLGIAAVMTLIAGFTAAGRNERRYRGIGLNTVVSVWASSWLVTGFALLLVLRGDEAVDGEMAWYRPQYAIPLLGMILGNTLNGITVGLNAFTEAVSGRRAEVEAGLAVGATRWEAARPRGTACGAAGDDADHQFDARRRDRQFAGDDDRPDLVGDAADRGGQIPDRLDVLDRVGNGDRDDLGGAAELRPLVHARTSVRVSAAVACGVTRRAGPLIRRSRGPAPNTRDFSGSIRVCR